MVSVAVGAVIADPCAASLPGLGARERLCLHPSLLTSDSSKQRKGKPAFGCVNEGHYVPQVIPAQFPPGPAMGGGPSPAPNGFSFGQGTQRAGAMAP